jgi:hypothetical protein
MKKAVYVIVAFLCMSSSGSAPFVLAYPPGVAIQDGYKEIIWRDALARIMAVLENKNVDRKILDKAAEKLAAMSRHDIRLISALCDRISTDRGTAGADIAFSLITAMIVFS